MCIYIYIHIYIHIYIGLTLRRRNRLAWPHRRRRLASDGVGLCGRTEQRRRQGSKRCTTKVRMVWGRFLIAAAALKTPTRHGYTAQGVNLNF